MLDLIPFMDEVAIVDLGYQFLSGGTSDSIVISSNGQSAMFISYLGPVMQEIMFRLFGQTGVRFCPFVGLAAIWFLARICLKKFTSLQKPFFEALALYAALCPLLFQGTILTRVDSWAIACDLAVLALLGTPDRKRSILQIACAGFLAALAPFVWATAAIVAPLYFLLCFNWKCKKELALFVLSGIVGVFLVSIPHLVHLQQLIISMSGYSGEHIQRTFPLANIISNFICEFLRDPPMLALSAVGFFFWMRRRLALAASFVLIVILCAYSGLYTMRFIYLTPYLLFMCATAAEKLCVAHPRGTVLYLRLMATYAVLTGPVAYLLLPHDRLPENLKEELATLIGTGPKWVYSPDYATYYIGRELGWNQFAHGNFADDRNPQIINRSLQKADAVILRDWNPYKTIQESWTPYGILTRALKHAAEKGKNLKSKPWLSRYGEQFCFPWRTPYEVTGFHKAKQIDCIQIYLKN